MHDVVVLFLDRPESDFWVVGFVHKSLSLFCGGGTSSGNPNDKQPTAILVWYGSQVRLWSTRTGTLILYRSPFTVHTRKSTSSTVLFQSDGGVQYVDCNPGKVNAREKGPIGGCMTCLYCIALTGCRLDTRHR